MPRRATVMYMPRDAKVNEAQPKTAEQIFAEKDAKIAELEKELTALKEKYRWRKQSEEPAPRGELVLIRYTDYDDEDHYGIVKMENMYDPDGEIAYPLMYWRPLDLPETEVAE